MNFLPHGHCYFWNPVILVMQLLGDLLIAGSYFVITYLLWRFSRIKHIPYSSFFGYFAAFIFWCGLTHIMDIVIVWSPVYFIETAVIVITAFFSVMTAYTLFSELDIIERILDVIHRHNEPKIKERGK